MLERVLFENKPVEYRAKGWRYGLWAMRIKGCIVVKVQEYVLEGNGPGQGVSVIHDLFGTRSAALGSWSERLDATPCARVTDKRLNEALDRWEPKARALCEARMQAVGLAPVAPAVVPVEAVPATL